MLRFSLLGSGSQGNAVLVSSGKTKILIDNGLSFKQLRLRAAEIGETLEGIEALFVTHEHRDHVAGLGILTRKMDIPVFMTERTRDSLPASIGPVKGITCIEAGEAVSVDGMTISSFSISHDAADPVSYVVESEGVKLGLAADLGHPSNVVRTRLMGCHGLILESNYCPDMLRRSAYPPAIQQRIRGRQGHLSNSAMCSLLAGLLHEALRHVVLVHISEENNQHQLALDMARQVIRELPIEVCVALQNQPTPLFELRL